jgi:GDPmannose 4,6-dehydratase
LITGVTGQDGSFLAELLLSEGVEVHGLVRPGDPGIDAVRALAPGLVIHDGDLADQESIDAVVDAVRPDEVYNLAGISSVALSWEQPALTADLTGAGAVRVLQAVLGHQRSTGRDVRFLQASSAEIFGEPAVSPQTEDTPLHPINPYGAAKAFAHTVTGQMRSRGLHASTVILYNHESPRRPDAFVTRKITKAAAAIARGSQDPLMLGNLDAQRDWGYAGDYVDAMRRAVRGDEPGDYVVATGHARTVADFVAAAFTAAGVPDWSSHVGVDPQFVRPRDATLLVGDATRAREVLGWEPSTSFDDLVRLMVEADLAALGT